MPVSPSDRVGYWDFSVQGDTTKWRLDFDEYVSKVRAQMFAIEEDLTRQAVVEKLRELGYTVMEPKVDVAGVIRKHLRFHTSVHLFSPDDARELGAELAAVLREAS